MRAVITAGGRIGGAYAQAAGTTVKALAPVRGRTMLERVVDAVRGAGASEIALVGPDEARNAAVVDRFVAQGASGSENVQRALGAWPDDDALLYATSDLPYVSAAGLALFVQLCGELLGMPLTPYERFAQRFPGASHPGIRIGGEHVVNGGVFYLPAGTASRVAGLATRLFDLRKNPLAMARLGGIGVVTGFLLGTLRIEDLERRAERVLHVGVQAVRDCAPELAFDADELVEYRYACEHA